MQACIQVHIFTRIQPLYEFCLKCSPPATNADNNYQKPNRSQSFTSPRRRTCSPTYL